MTKGKLIVLEGCDGIGKKTQTEILIKRLEKDGYNVKAISFPNYSSTYGKQIKVLLENSKDPFALDPYDFGKLFALDRLNEKQRLEDWLKSSIVICDRYMECNLAYQGAKLNGEERKRIWDFFINLEYKENKLPRPNVVIYLDLPSEVSKGLMLNRQEDVNEKSLMYQNAVREAFLELIENETSLRYGINWIKIDCYSKEKGIKGVDEIAEMIYRAVKPILV